MTRRSSLAFAALLGALVILAYANSLGVGFHFDDINGLVQNPSIRSLRNIPSFFRDPFTLTLVRENVDVRPVLQTTYALNYAVSGLEPWSWHALNIALHFAAAFLVFLLVRDHRWPDGDAAHDAAATRVAGAAALLFALAPLNSQPLDYMWARSALLCTVLYLGAFYAWLRGRWTAMALLLTVALLTKAIAITLPGAAVLYSVLYGDHDPNRGRPPGIRGWLRAWRTWLGPIALMLAIDGGYLLFRAWILPAWANQPAKEAFATPWIWLMSGWSAQLYYVRLFLWPAAPGSTSRRHA